MTEEASLISIKHVKTLLQQFFAPDLTSILIDFLRTAQNASWMPCAERGTVHIRKRELPDGSVECKRVWRKVGCLKKEWLNAEEFNKLIPGAEGEKWCVKHFLVRHRDYLYSLSEKEAWVREQAANLEVPMTWIQEFVPKSTIISDRSFFSRAVIDRLTTHLPDLIQQKKQDLARLRTQRKQEKGVKRKVVEV